MVLEKVVSAATKSKRLGVDDQKTMASSQELLLEGEQGANFIMVATVDSQNPAWLNLHYSTTICRVLVSRVMQDFYHEQYDAKTCYGCF